MGSAYPLTGRSILIVEDEPLIALEVASLFNAAGAEVISVRSRSEALVAIKRRNICAALLDYRLGDDDVVAVSALLVDRSIPFMFYGGYSDLREHFPTHIVVQKPATSEVLLNAMTGLLTKSLLMDGSL